MRVYRFVLKNTYISFIDTHVVCVLMMYYVDEEIKHVSLSELFSSPVVIYITHAHSIIHSENSVAVSSKILLRTNYQFDCEHPS